LFTRVPPPVPPRTPGTTPRRTSRASVWPALDAAGGAPARAPGHAPDGWLMTGSLLGLLEGGCFKRLGGTAANAMRTALRASSKALATLEARRGGAAAEPGAHDGTVSTRERRVHTRAGVQDAATARDAAHGPQRGAVGRR